MRLQSKPFEIHDFNPVRVRGELYGSAVVFSNAKARVAFQSEFKPPAYLQYDKIRRVLVRHDPKRWLLVLGCLTILLVAGFFILFVYTRYPKWLVQLDLKGPRDRHPPVKVRARFSAPLARILRDYLAQADVPVTLENLPEAAPPPSSE